MSRALSDIECNRCNAGLLDNYGVCYKCRVCGQWYDPLLKKFSEEIGQKRRLSRGGGEKIWYAKDIQQIKDVDGAGITH